MKVIDLLNKIANGEIEDKRTFKLVFPNKIHRSIYYDENESNCLYCLKNVSDNEPIFDDIDFNDEVEIIEDKEDINIQDIKELPEYIHIGDGGADADVKDEVNIKINEIIRAVKYLEKTKEDK